MATPGTVLPDAVANGAILPRPWDFPLAPRPGTPPSAWRHSAGSRQEPDPPSPTDPGDLIRFEVRFGEVPRSPDDTGIGALAARFSKVLTACQRRLQELTEDARLEGSRIHIASRSTFFDFLVRTVPVGRGRLVLLENGNLRATWKGGDDTHVGLQFLTDGRIQYVIFTRRPGAPGVSRVAGRDTIAGVRRQLHAFDLTDLFEI